VFPEQGQAVGLSKESKLELYGNALREGLHILVGVAKELSGRSVPS
jgi:hypothetical protein